VPAAAGENSASQANGMLLSGQKSPYGGARSPNVTVRRRLKATNCDRLELSLTILIDF